MSKQPEARLQQVRSGMVTGGEAVRLLESSDEYVFHGTRTPGIEEFEPRQAHNDGKPDGAPAVFATPRADIAVFAAVVKGRGRHTAWEISIRGEVKCSFYASEDAIQKAKAKANEGWVYVFDRRHFMPFRVSEQEWVAYAPVAPQAAILVKYSDLLAPVSDIAEWRARRGQSNA